MYLITGARGRVARGVADALRVRGGTVRLASRHPEGSAAGSEFEIAEADIAETRGWDEALEGVEAVLLYADRGGVESFLGVASRAGAPRVVLLSGRGADGESDDPITRMHRAAEEAVHRSGLPSTVLRPGGFATNTLQWGASIREHRRVALAFPGAHANLLHERDLVEVAADVMSAGDAHVGRIYEPTGPGSLDQLEQVAAIEAAIGEPVRVDEIDEDAYRETLRRWGDDEMVDTLVAHLRDAVDREDQGTDDVRAVLGRPARPYGEWARDHVDDFR